MDIDSLTYGELKKIAALFAATEKAETSHHPFVGKYVICRCYAAGVHAGILVSQNGDQVILKDSRRLWNWKNKGGVALSGLAVNGMDSGKVDTELKEISLIGVCETIPCSKKSETSIREA